MSALKTKVPRLKSIAGKTDTGGAPFFSEDMITIQENNRADFINTFEALRRQLPPLEYFQGAGNPIAKEFENGLILSGCEYDNSVITAPVISPGYILSGGEICYFPGGTFSTSPTSPGLIYLFKGAALPVSRTFDDGNNKEMLVSYACVVEQGTYGGQGPALPAGTTIVPTDEVVVISVGNTSVGAAIAELYFSVQAALKVNEIGAVVGRPAFVDAIFSYANVTLATPPIQQLLASRVDSEGFTEIIGSFKVAVAAMTSGLINVFDLAPGAFVNSGSYSAPIQARFYTPLSHLNDTCVLSFNGLGAVTLREPASGWPPTDLTITICARVYAGNSKPTSSYTYKQDFLNIT